MNNILVAHKDFSQGDCEFIERKGFGLVTEENNILVLRYSNGIFVL